MSAPIEIYADFEYRLDGRQLILGCFLLHRPDQPEFDSWVIIDFRSVTAEAELAALFYQYPDATWFSYAALAELGCFELCHLDVRAMDWICLYAEAKQIVASHDRFWLPGGHNLIAVLARFGIATRGSAFHKERMRDLILATDEYTPAQWDSIVDYCRSDIEPLPELWRRIQDVHAELGKPFGKDVAIFHADYLTATAHLEAHSRGFPIDVDLLNLIYDNIQPIRRMLAEQANATYGPVFHYDPVPGKYHFTMKGLLDNIAAQPVTPIWQLTPTGRPRMDDEYFEEFVKKNPYYKPLRDVTILLSQLKKTDLRDRLEGNFIRGVSLPYHTVTGRNQPLPAKGFVLNLPSWMRSLVRPEPNHVVIAADWSQQEICIACSLSGDEALASALRSGDCYTAMAKLAGAIPPDGNKRTHPAQRQLYKSLQLGLGYSMGVDSLARRIFIDMTQQGHVITEEEAADTATDLMRWHRSTFKQFWAWNQSLVRRAKFDGWLATKDNWTMFVGPHTKTTLIGNYPMQANAASILREAIKLLAAENVELICSHHDAVYLYAHEDDCIDQQAILSRCMTQGARNILQHTRLPMDITIDLSVYTHAEGYSDPRGKATFDAIMAMLTERHPCDDLLSIA